MLTESLILGLGILLLRGQGKHYVEQVHFKGLWLPIAAFLLEWLCGHFLGKWQFIQTQTLLIEGFVYSSLLIFVWLNRHLKGFGIAGLGLILNACVVLINNGYMPVDGEALRHFGFLETYDTLKQMKVFGHNLMTDQTKLAFLGDVIHIKPPYPMPKSISFGDVILGLGIWVHLALYKGTSDALMRGGKQ